MSKLTRKVGGMKRPQAATVIACTALFFSLTGAGLAASHYLITSVSQIKPSVRHALSGARGARGLPGATGATGAQGIPGSTGPQGPAGAPAATVNLDGDYSVTTGAKLCSPATVNCSPTADITARCQPGDHVLQGGYQGSNEIATASQLAAASFANGAFTGRGWNVAARLDAASSSGSVSAEVLCVH